MYCSIKVDAACEPVAAYCRRSLQYAECVRRDNAKIFCQRVAGRSYRVVHYAAVGLCRDACALSEPQQQLADATSGEDLARHVQREIAAKPAAYGRRTRSAGVCEDHAAPADPARHRAQGDRTGTERPLTDIVKWLQARISVAPVASV
jgi:hypothetical protein